MSAVTAFRDALTSAMSASGRTVARWSGASTISDHLLELDTRPRPTVLYVKESNSTPPFWGLTRNQLDCLRQATVRWFVVLLEHGVARGYVLTGGQVEIRIADGTFELSNDGDHKVNDGDLSAAQRFGDLSELVARIV